MRAVKQDVADAEYTTKLTTENTESTEKWKSEKVKHTCHSCGGRNPALMNPIGMTLREQPSVTYSPQKAKKIEL